METHILLLQIAVILLVGRLLAELATRLHAPSIIAYTTLFAPFWIKSFYRRFGDRLPTLK